MVVVGHLELAGSDERRALRAIENASKERKTPVHISSVHMQLDSALNVNRSENTGRVLNHVAVLRKLVRIGMADRNAGFSGEFQVDTGNREPRNLRIVAFNVI